MSFISKNYDAPFSVKKLVWRSALLSSIMFSCETWLTNNLKPIEKIYNETLKNLLGVRRSTCNDIVYIETGLPDAKNFIRDRQNKFFRKLYDSSHYRGSYIERVINLVKNNRTPAGRYIVGLENENINILENFQLNLRNSIINSNSSKRNAYKLINPDLSVNKIYSLNVLEYKRIETFKINFP